MASKFLDDSGLAYLWLKIKALVATKVDKVDGKGLSSNDYTSDEKAKLANVASGAQVNVLEGIQKNGESLPITNKIANITVPTATSDLTNDSGFITAEDVPEGVQPSTMTPLMDGTGAAGSSAAYARADHVHPADTSRASLVSPNFTGTPTAPTATAGTNTTQIATTEFVKTAVDNAIAGVTQFSYEVVASLPATGEAGKIYLIAHAHGTNDAYDEYIWTGSGYEKIGNTDVDLSGYMLKTDMVAMTTTEIDTACA